MSSTNKTANYKLSQFISTDKPTFLGDYNNDMQIIDGAIFEANQSAEQALNDVEAVKGAQAELKNVHTETQEQVAQLKETADGMAGDVTAAQEVANSTEQKATEAQSAATVVVNAANAASVNATKAKQTADGNKVTLEDLKSRVKALESAPKLPNEITVTVGGCGVGETSKQGKTIIYKNLTNLTLKEAKIYEISGANINDVKGVTGVTNINTGSEKIITADMVQGDSFSLACTIGGGLRLSAFKVDITYSVLA